MLLPFNSEGFLLHNIKIDLYKTIIASGWHGSKTHGKQTQLSFQSREYLELKIREQQSGENYTTSIFVICTLIIWGLFRWKMKVNEIRGEMEC